MTHLDDSFCFQNSPENPVNMESIVSNIERRMAEKTCDCSAKVDILEKLAKRSESLVDEQNCDCPVQLQNCDCPVQPQDCNCPEQIRIVNNCEGLIPKSECKDKASEVSV